MTTSSLAKILLLEDEVELRDEIRDFFLHHGLQLQVVGSLKQFWHYANATRPDLVILDRRLPDGDGLTVLQDLRKSGSQCGVIMLTAVDRPQEVLHAFESLADHYLTKPVSMRQLLAVVRTVLWRLNLLSKGWELHVSHWLLIDPSGNSMELTSQEFDFIRSLASQPGQARSRHKLAEDIGKSIKDYDIRNLDALVLRLRKKALQSSLDSLPIKAVHGIGYLFSHGITVI